MSDEAEKKSGEWMQTLWRPAMGWMYMLICLADMLVFPVLWSLLQAMTHQPITQWNPLTLQGAGLFHIAMGAVLGIAAFGRTQEKIAGSAANIAPPAPSFGGSSNGGFNVPSSGFTAPSAPQAGFNPAPTGFSGGGFGSTPALSPVTATGGFGGNPTFGATATPAVTASGKKIVPTDDPLI